MKKHIYHVRKREDVLQEGLVMKLEGLPVKGADVGLLGLYNLYVDLELGVGKAMLRQIPCTCAPCKEFTKHPWKAGVPAKTNFALNRIGCVSTGKCFRVRMTGFLYKQLQKRRQIEQSQKEVLGGIMTKMAETIKEGNYGAVITEDNNTHGYYVVHWASELFASQEDTDKSTVGELVCDGTCLNPVGRARNWYTQGEESVTIQVQHVVAANLELLKPSD
jgi:hypothetical protein